MQSSDVSTPPTDRQSPFAPRDGQSPSIKFSAEEVRVIKECNRESFFTRCIPISAVLGFGTYYGVKSGYFKSSAKLGATPKVFAAVLAGYFLGKISYQSKCAEKLMQLPNSQLGEILRQRRRGKLQENSDPSFGTSLSLAPFGSVNSADTYPDMDPYPSNIEVDTNRPHFEGLDETYRPSLDNPIYEEEEMPPVQKNTTTYDELRKQNREEYQQKRIGNYKEPTSPRTTTLYQPPSPSSNFPSGKNRYGDDME